MTRLWGNLEWCLQGELLRQHLWREIGEATIKYVEGEMSNIVDEFFNPEESPLFRRIRQQQALENTNEAFSDGSNLL